MQDGQMWGFPQHSSHGPSDTLGGNALQGLALQNLQLQGQGKMSTQQPRPNLQQEIEEFGRQIAESLRIARDSPRGKQVETQIRVSLRDLEKYLNEAYNSVRAHVDTPEFKSQVVTSAKDAADEVQSQLAIGLRALNAKIKEMLKEAENTTTDKAG